MNTSFVPAILQRAYLSDPQRNPGEFVLDSHATILWIDICNFSPLCNRLMRDPVRGVEKITTILKEHYDHVLDIITAYGAEPLFFVGDGLMVGWTGTRENARSRTPDAVACAHKLVASPHTLDDQDQPLSYHLIVSTGRCHTAEIGGVYDSKLLAFFGEVFVTFIRASKNRAPDQLIITDEALAHIPDHLRRTPLDNGASILLEWPDVEPRPPKPIGDLRDDMVEMLMSFAPLTINFPISEERLKWISEIRPVSVLFVRLPNLDADAQRQFERLKKLGSLAVPLVRKYDGLINQIWIDEKDSNLYICFGPAPSAHVDNPMRCVRLALDLRNEYTRAGINVSMGICTGMGYCGVLGNNKLRQFTVLGDVVNLSARIAAVAGDRVWCDEKTFKATYKVIEYADPVSVEIKGHPRPVQLYQPLREKSGKTRHLQSDPAIGRDTEIGRLEEAFALAQKGTGGIIMIEGEQGIGKSEVLRTFKSRQIAKGYVVFEGAGDFIERQTPYSIWKEIFVGLLNLDEAINANDNDTLLMALPESYRPKAALLNSVLSADLPESELTGTMTGGQKVRETHAFLLQILLEATRTDQFVILLDDAQWMDENGWALARDLYKAQESSLIIMAFGESEDEGLLERIKADVTDTITLGPLSREDQDLLICETLAVSNISGEISALIRQVTKGNPFFTTELISALRDQDLLVVHDGSCELREGAVIDDSSLPETVRGTLRRKIDRLAPGSRLSVKVGSVVGPRFAKDIVQSIYPIAVEKPSVPQFLALAERSGLINETPVDNLHGFSFNNAVTAEVAYEMTLAEQRRQLHKESAVWYEQYFKNNLPPFFVRLAHHWQEAGDLDRSVEYHEKEAVRLFRQGFAKNSLDIGLKGVELLGLVVERTPETIVPRIQEHMGAIQAFMADKEVTSLIDHKPLENARTERLIQLLLELTPYAHQSHQAELFALMAIISMRKTLEEGNGAAAAEVYSMYAIIYKAFTGDSAGAHDWSKLALAIDKLKGHTRFSRVAFIHCWFIGLWVEPLRGLIPMARQAADAGFESGDIVYGCFNLSLTTVLIAASGYPLDDVIRSATDGFIRNPNLVINASFHLIHEEQVAKAFQGKTESLTSLTDHKYDEAKDIASICDTDLVNQIGYYLISKLQLHVHFGNWSEALTWGDKAWPLLPGFANQPGHFHLEQYYTIAALYLAHEQESDSDVAEKLATAAAEGMARLDQIASVCPANFAHKALLVKAIHLGLGGETDRAVETFQEAAEKAHAQQFIHDEGLCYEHLARMLHQNGMDHSAALSSTIDAYTRWGAQGKVEYVRALFDTGQGRS